MNTMLISGIPMVRALELTAGVVGNHIYYDILMEASAAVKAGRAMSDALAVHRKEIPSIMIQMIKVGEESGELGKILENSFHFLFPRSRQRGRHACRPYRASHDYPSWSRRWFPYGRRSRAYIQPLVVNRLKIGESV